MLNPHVLILAAGAARRMRGQDKLLEQVAGEAQLARIARAALATGLPVAVALPPDRPARAAVLTGLGVGLIGVAAPERGLSESLKAGVAALPADTDILLLLADLPEITSTDLAQVLAVWAQHPGAIVRGTDSAGRPGHPVGLPRWTRPEVMRLEGDEGARALLAAHRDRVLAVPLPQGHATTDLDTPEDWAAWRALRGQ